MCDVIGVDPENITYFWTYNGIHLFKETGSTITLLSNNNAGFYTCIAADRFGVGRDRIYIEEFDERTTDFEVETTMAENDTFFPGTCIANIEDKLMAYKRLLSQVVFY